MKNIIIISEYNLFHNGHKRQYEQLRVKYSQEGCRIIAVMSGNYTQRGIVALLPKHERAKIAVDEGADLVLELPYPWSCAPAEIFARAGVFIASSLGADILCFGSESGNIDKLKETADRLSSPDFSSELELARAGVSHSGESYIKTRERVYNKLYGELPPNCANDILGVEYLRAITEQKSSITPYAMLREGDETSTLTREYARTGDIDKLCSIAPASTCEAVRNIKTVSDERLGILVLGLLRLAEPSELAVYADISFGLACRMCNAARNVDTFDEYYTACATKKYTDAQIRRCTLNALMRVTPERLCSMPMYTNLLAANASGCGFLSETRRLRNLSVISKAENIRGLDSDTRAAYDFAEKADKIYELISQKKTSAKPYIK